MKINGITLCILLLLFFSCTIPNNNNQFILKWEDDFCTVTINGEKLSGGYYEKYYDEGQDNLELYVEAREDLGWFFDHYSFSRYALPDPGYFSEDTNPLNFEVDDYYRNCSISLKTFTLSRYGRDQNNNSIFMEITCPSYENSSRFFQYDFNNSLSEISSPQSFSNGIESIDTYLDEENLMVVIQWSTGATQNIQIPGLWRDSIDYKMSPDRSSLLLETGIWDHDLRKEIGGYFIWKINEEQLTSIPYEKSAITCWEKDSDNIYFFNWVPHYINPEYSDVDWTDLYVDGFNLATGEIRNIFTKLNDPGSKTWIYLFSDSFLIKTRDNNVEVRAYSGEILLSFDISAIEEYGYYRELFFQKDIGSLILWRDGYGLYEYNQTHGLRSLVSYSQIK